MQLGVISPQTEIGSGPIAVRDFAQAAESLGYQHLRVLEHVLGPGSLGVFYLPLSALKAERT